MPVANELPIFKGENKGCLINTANLQGLKYSEFLQEGA
jgi:hypothetical protein